jgi:serine/threonine protein kinase
VLKKPLAFPDAVSVSPACKDLITKLLNKEPGKRLGSKAGADEIKRHPWFAATNWALVRQQSPPFVTPRRSSAGAEGGRPSRPLSDGSEPRVHSADSVLPDPKPAAAAAAAAAPGQQPKAKSEGAAVAAGPPLAAAAAGEGPGHIDGF